MRLVEAAAALLLGPLAMCLAVWAGVASGDDPISAPYPKRDSPAEQSAWLDQVITQFLSVMRDSKEVRAKVVGPHAAVKSRSFPMTTRARKLVQSELERWLALADAAVAANPRYGPGSKERSRPVSQVMPRSGIVRVEVTYPAPAASPDLEPGPLTIDAWICPDRETALILFWLRSVHLNIDTRSPETLRQSVLDTKAVMPPLPPEEKPPGERAFWYFPRLMISVVLPKGHKPMPADRLCFLRDNVIVEASTVELTRSGRYPEWGAWSLKQCAADVISVMRSIDTELKKPWQ